MAQSTAAARKARGDFQTPDPLAGAICAHLDRLGVRPAHVAEPTCGSGAFLRAAAAAWPGVPITGWELDPDHRAAAGEGPWTVHDADAFRVDWCDALPDVPGVLVLGNPPWVSADRLTRLAGASPPRRSGRSTGDARTGGSNFDTAEWLLRAWLEALAGRDATIAMLVKATVMRRVLLAAHRDDLPLAPVGWWRVDARRWFGASVRAGLFVFRTQGARAPCPVAPRLDAPTTGAVCVDGGRWIADADAWAVARHLAGPSPVRWRSGVKHDCADVMELADGRNGYDELVDVEPAHTAPLAKGADLAAGRGPSRRLVLPHRRPDAPTGPTHTGPRTWAYLRSHAARLDGRRSRIWRKGPRFGLYGLGGYSFAPWKVAVPCVHAPTVFRVVGPVDGEPVLLDDTCAFVPFADERAAREAAAALNHTDVAAFLRARRTEGGQRRVTVRVLNDLDWTRAPS